MHIVKFLDLKSHQKLKLIIEIVGGPNLCDCKDF